MPQPIKAGEVFDLIRTLLNDASGDANSDDDIIPLFKLAYEELRQECEDNNIPFTNLTSAGITIPQGATDIGGATGPALPEDLIEPVELYERLAGTNNDFMLMDRKNFLPKTDVLTSYLRVYTWQKQELRFLGANGAVEIKIDYVGNPFINQVNANSQIILFNCKNFLGYRTAALCAEFIGENKTRADSLNTNAGRSIDTLTNIGVKNQQGMVIRRRPFMASYRRTSYGGYR